MNKHEENRENDVKENEKSGEMRGFAGPKTGDAGPKTGDAGLKTGDLGTPKKKRIPCGCTSQNPTKSTTQKVDENKNYYPF